jgi:hypothetical protein
LKKRSRQVDNEYTLSLAEKKERVIRKSYALTKHDLKNIELIKDKCLNKKIVLRDSFIIRLALELAGKLPEEDLIKGSEKIPKIATGRPKKKLTGTQ